MREIRFRAWDEDNGMFQVTDLHWDKEGCLYKHTPFVVLTEPISLCKSAQELVDTFPPETEVIAQWQGQWRSDFFYFRVQDIIDFWNK